MRSTAMAVGAVAAAAAAFASPALALTDIDFPEQAAAPAIACFHVTNQPHQAPRPADVQDMLNDAIVDACFGAP